jgi:hypothetical protein
VSSLEILSKARYGCDMDISFTDIEKYAGAIMGV